MDGRFGPNFERGIAGIHGPSIWSEFLKRNAGIHGRPNRSNTIKLNIFSHLTDYGLSGHMVFDRGQIRTASKMYLKTQSCNKFYDSLCMTHTI